MAIPNVHLRKGISLTIISYSHTCNDTILGDLGDRGELLGLFNCWYKFWSDSSDEDSAGDKFGEGLQREIISNFSALLTFEIPVPKWNGL